MQPHDQPETIDETIIIVRHPSTINLYKLFSCKTTDKVIYEEKLRNMAQVWCINEITIFGYIACSNSDILKDKLYIKLAKGFNRVVNDWVSINSVDLTYKLKRGVQKYGHGAILSIKKSEKKQPKRRQVRNDSDSE